MTVHQLSVKDFIRHNIQTTYQRRRYAHNQDLEASPHLASVGPTPRSRTIVLPSMHTSPAFSPNSNSRPSSTWNTLKRSSSPPPLLLTFSTCKLFAAASNNLPTLQSLLYQYSPFGNLLLVVFASASTCRYILLSVGTFASPLAVRFSVFTAMIRLAAVDGFGFGRTAACFSLPQTRNRPSAAFAFSACVGPLEGRAPIGTRVEQLWSSFNRCLRQYWRLQVGQPTPTELSVLIYVLQLGWEHCVAVKRVGFPGVALFVVAESAAAFRLAAAHSPARGHLCPVSVR